MNLPRLAVRALNEYRRVCLFTYLALRYNLLSTAACNKRWANEVAPEILHRRAGPAYLPCRQFKQIRANGSFEYRDIYYPCANEVLAEAALLAYCADVGGPFGPKDDVFSYHLAPGNSREGSFKSYYKLFAARQAAIGKACQHRPNDIVLCVDIKSFYPSVSIRRAKSAWFRACDEAQVDEKWRSLGSRLLDEQRAVSKGLLVGPMFSHLLGNLVLLEFDQAMRKRFRGMYFRYVDDIAVVIPTAEYECTLHFIRCLLKKHGLVLNGKKTSRLRAQDWRSATNHPAQDYEGEVHRTGDKHWMEFVDRLKCYLIAHRDDGDALAEHLHAAKIRVSIPQYLAAVQDAGYVSRFGRRVRSKAFKKSIAQTSIQSLVRDAQALGRLYQNEFHEVWQAFQSASSMKRKSLLSRLRYVLGRLVLVAPEDKLDIYADKLESRAELAEYGAIFKALATRDVSNLLRFSGKVNAGAGQALATMRRPVSCAPNRWSREAIEGYLALRLLGVDLVGEVPLRVQQQALVRFATGVRKKDDWFAAQNDYLKELFSLSAQSTLQRHCSLLQETADPDERWVLFADELRGISS